MIYLKMPDGKEYDVIRNDEAYITLHSKGTWNYSVFWSVNGDKPNLKTLIHDARRD